MAQSKKRRTSVALTPISKESVKTPTSIRDTRHMFPIPIINIIEAPDQKGSSKFKTSIKPRKSSYDYELNLGTEIRPHIRSVSRTPKQVKKFIFPEDGDDSQITPSDFDIPGDIAKIALRDDFRHGSDNTAKKISIKKTHFRGLSLKSIEEEVKYEQSEGSDDKSSVRDKSMCSLRSNTKLLKSNKTIKFLSKDDTLINPSRSRPNTSIKPPKTIMKSNNPQLKSDFTRKYSINAYGILKKLKNDKRSKTLLITDDVAMDNSLDISRQRVNLF
jgi:hypothetical protein